jgi:hypothetical protein
MKADQMFRTIEVHDKRGNVIGTREVVLYVGLLSKAHDEGLVRIRTRLVQSPTEENGRTAIAKAFVETKKGQFDGIGDANPENVNSFIAPHLIRVAETRAKARALRDAVNIGVVSFEELNGDGIPDEPVKPGRRESATQPRERVAKPIPTTPAQENTPNPGPMSESQRRYLFRLMATKGYVAEAAEVKLKELLKVEVLTDATKSQATVLIDQLIRENAIKVSDGQH